MVGSLRARACRESEQLPPAGYHEAARSGEIHKVQVFLLEFFQVEEELSSSRSSVGVAEIALKGAAANERAVGDFDKGDLPEAEVDLTQTQDYAGKRTRMSGTRLANWGAIER